MVGSCSSRWPVSSMHAQTNRISRQQKWEEEIIKKLMTEKICPIMYELTGLPH